MIEILINTETKYAHSAQTELRESLKQFRLPCLVNSKNLRPKYRREKSGNKRLDQLKATWQIIDKPWRVVWRTYGLIGMLRIRRLTLRYLETLEDRDYYDFMEIKIGPSKNKELGAIMDMLLFAFKHVISILITKND